MASALDVKPDSLTLDKLGLNSKQLEAVKYFENPLLILAGAGTGKTKTLTSKIALLIASGISPSKILAITFTNKAAAEMRQRIMQITPYSGGIWMHTFHALGAKLLRRHGELIGIKQNFLIYDEDDQKKLIGLILKEIGLESEKNKIGLYISLISKAKDDLIDEEAYLINAEASGETNRLKTARIYRLYQAKLALAGALDFGDLIHKACKLLKEKDDLREYYQEYFQYVLVDEYQDTNHAQYVLIKTLSEKHQNLCVVGDPDQTIYSWRGANIRNIMEFEKDFKNAKTIILEQNYRSTANILTAANKVITRNRNRQPKNLWTENNDGDSVKIIECASEIDESKFIYNKIKSLTASGAYTYNDFVVFYRTNAQSRSFEETFMKMSIPYRIVGSIKFYNRKEIKDAVAYFRLLANPYDTVSLMRIINTPARGIGKTALEKIQAYAMEKQMPLFDALENEYQIPKLTPMARRGIKEFTILINSLKEELNETPLYLIIEKLLTKSGYWQSIEDLSEKDPAASLAKLGNLQELVNAVKEFEDRMANQNIPPSIHKFLENVSLASEVDNLEYSKYAVTLMTVHLAKGLEFPAVFLTGLEDGLFPINASHSSNSEMEEERRLCYVGMTRAKQKLFMTWANTRKIFGKTEPNSASRFLFETELIEEEEKQKEEMPQSAPYVSTGLRITIGRKVAHPVYGIGRVINLVGTGEFTKVTVVFDNGGKQTFMLKYAPLEIV
ncbi:MAG: UvrD-helicase domain-containing protein [Elusimicrobia bacterium]|nr:UvrD-helicase domain-containing protein [Elusimicrobiota bacterium]